MMTTRLVVAVAALACGLGAAAGCCGDKRDGGAGGAAAVSDTTRTEIEMGGTRYSQTLQTLSGAPKDLVDRLRAATTVNVDAPGLGPAAAHAMPSKLGARIQDDLKPPERSGRPDEGIVLAVSAGGASFSFDGYPPIKIEGTLAGSAAGWLKAHKSLAPGVHAIKVECPGFFPVETQVLVRPGVYEIIAVRLGRVGMTDLKPGGVK